MQRQNTKGTTLLAPIGGMNSLDSLAALPPSDSVYCINKMSAEHGLRVREGFVSYSAVLPDTTDVRTILGYRGSKDDKSKDRFFVATNNGIYSLANPASPTEVIQFGITTGNAGWGTSLGFTTIGGSYLFYADEENGGFRYEEDTDTWAAIPDLTLDGNPFSAASIVHVCTYKNRLWFTIKDSAISYYLPVGQVSGALTAFDFGNKMGYGGSVVGIWSWSVEGGSGINEFLVAVGRGGDILVYQGIDPGNANSFGLKGSWYGGSFPAGRNFVSKFSGDLLILTEAGLLQLSKLVQGVATVDNDAYLSKKMYRFIREEMKDGKSKFGWQMVQHPRLGYLMIVVPPKSGASFTQFVMSVSNRAWSVFRGIPINCIGESAGELYFGTRLDDGKKVFKLFGALDNGSPITWSLLTRYDGLGDPTISKRVQFIRPVFVGSLIPAYDVQARYDFDIAAIVGAPALQDAGVGVWDIGFWDSAIWGGEWVTESQAYGGAGMGRYVAVAIRGSSQAETTLLVLDVLADAGGML